VTIAESYFSTKSTNIKVSCAFASTEKILPQTSKKVNSFIISEIKNKKAIKRKYKPTIKYKTLIL